MARVFLDTCVLVPPLLRDFLLGLADAGLFEPQWSAGVTAEWAHVAARQGGADVALRVARMRARWPQGEGPAGQPELLDLPDPGDRHVLAAAISGRAEVLLTQNLRDFPARALAPFGITARAPDDFAMALWLAEHAPVEAGVARVWSALTGAELRKALKSASLPRLGKALAND